MRKSDKIITVLSEQEPQLESSLRPKRLENFIGQDEVKEQLSIVLNAAIERGSVPDHILLIGPPGLGKTTLSMLIATEFSKPLKITSGPAIQHSGDLAAILSALDEGEVLFIDEIHRLSKPVEEMLYVAMEDFRVDIVVGKGPGANAIPLDLPHFTVVGATTRAGLLPAPLRDRFGFTGALDYYRQDELTLILKQSAKILNARIKETARNVLASRSRGTPRIANRLLKRVRDWNQIHNANKQINERAVNEALKIYNIDNHGLDKLDRKILRVLSTQKKPIGLSTIAAHTGESVETIETVVEPFLLRAGFIDRTPKGRVITGLGMSHIGAIKNPMLF
jgi:Holliday junction DNA helicase RuvB